jgi:hypothetical protein
MTNSVRARRPRPPARTAGTLPPVIRTITALAVTLACVLPATAAALPGDPPIVSQAPADGATAAIDPDGIPVSFTCPPYRSFDAGGGFIVYGGPKDYGASFSQSNALAADGRLADPVALNQASETPPTGSGQCTSALAAGARSARRRRPAPTTGSPGASARAARSATRPGPCGS